MEDPLPPVLLEQTLHVGDDETEHGPLDPGPFLGVVPLEVQLDPVPPHTGVPRIADGIGEGELKPEPADVETDRRRDIARRKHGPDRLEADRRPFGPYR